MRIGIEAQRLFRQKKHGMDIVILEILKQFNKIELLFDIYVFVAEGPDECIVSTNSRLHIVPLKSTAYPIWEQRTLVKATQQYQISVLHCTSNTFPIFAGIPIILTLHDIIFFETSFWKFSKLKHAFGNLYRKYNVILGQSALRHIITVSKSEKQTIENRFPKWRSKLSAVYNSVGQHFITSNSISNSELEDFRRSNGLPNQFILHFSNADPKKNTVKTLQAYMAYRNSVSEPIDLVLTDTDSAFLKGAFQEAAIPIDQNFVHIAAYIPNIDLPKVYKLAKALLYTSVRESFGIPILEAQACNCPVITSSLSAMPEIAGEGAVLVNTQSIQAMSEGILKALEQSNSLIEAGKDNITRFSWNTSANQYLAIYSQALNNTAEL